MKAVILHTEPDLRAVLASRIEDWGMNAFAAPASAQDAAACCAQADLVVSGYCLPGAHGTELCHRIRSSRTEGAAYVIFVVDPARGECVADALRAGADDCIEQPINWSEMAARVEAASRRIEAQRQANDEHERLRELAMRDPLTGLWNRRAVMQALQREFVRHRRERRSMAVVMLDLDRFKEVNDRLGHSAGDDVIRKAASRMNARVRPYDTLGRYGGEEFIALLPGCTTDAAFTIADRLRTSLTCRPIRTQGCDLAVTVSIGVASCADLTSHAAWDLVQAADAALYQAKCDGRNCVRTAPASEGWLQPAASHRARETGAGWLMPAGHTSG